MSQRAVIITGALGGIGRALCIEFHNHNYAVIAIDRDESDDAELCAFRFLRSDIQNVVTSSGESSLVKDIQKILKENDLQLNGLVNNAAIQILGGTKDLSVSDWEETLRTNLLAPFFLTQAFLSDLIHSKGSVVNVSSIHEKLTKAGFLAYATSKAALSGMTRAMAVELGEKVRVNAICPAAIETPMLKEGFEGNESGFEALGAAHPTRRIGRPEEVAQLTRYLIEDAPVFLTGSCLGLDGGISGRLHDPI